VKDINWESLLSGDLDKHGFAIINGHYAKDVNWFEMPIAPMFFDLGFRRGAGVFEVMIAKKKKVFHVKDHIKRLKRSMELMGIKGPSRLPIGWVNDYFFPNFLESATKRVLEKNSKRWENYPYSLVYLFMTGGFAKDGMVSEGSNLFIATAPFVLKQSDKTPALRLKIIYHIPHLLNAKTQNNYFKASSELSGLKEFDEVLYAKPGHITECSRANFFIIKGKKIKTAPKRAIVSGVTRKVTIALAQKAGYEVEENYFGLKELVEADEAFITSTTYGIWPVFLVNIESLKKAEGVDFSKKDVYFPKMGKNTCKLHKMFRKYQNDYFGKRINIFDLKLFKI